MFRRFAEQNCSVRHAVSRIRRSCAKDGGPIPDGVAPKSLRSFAVNFFWMWSILARMSGRRVEECLLKPHVVTSTGDRERNTPALTKGERP
jgi:hypothetical protein